MGAAPRNRRRLRTLATCSVLIWAASSWTGCAPELPNVVFVTFDTTRPDRLGLGGDPEAHTPTLDALAERGLVFEHAYATSPVTLPSHATLFSGVDPRSHGVHDNGRHRLPESVTTVAERLRDAGFQTGAFVSAFVLDPRFGLDQGFETYHSESRPDSHPLRFLVPSRPADAVSDDAIEWLGSRDVERPFFLWVHYYDPHQPNRLRPEFAETGDAYASEIAYADHHLGRLLAAVDATRGPREALVIFTSDHGESLGAHGELTHGLLAYDTTLHVPLVLAGPGIPAGARSAVLARQIDVVPTLLAALGLDVPPALPGRNLLMPEALAASSGEEVWDYFESRGPVVSLGWAPIEGIRTERWKYTATPLPAELYDVLADPHEEHNRIASEPELADRLRTLHERAVANSSEKARAPENLPPETDQLLRALGYVDAAGRFEPGREPDPRANVQVHGWVEQARSMALAGRYDAAVEALEVIAQSAAVRALALRTLAPIYTQLGRHEDAVRAYRDAYTSSGARVALEQMVGAMILAERPEEALDALDAENADWPEAELLRAAALARLGRIAEANAAVDAALPGPEQRVERLREKARVAAEGAHAADALRALLTQVPGDPVVRSHLGYRLALQGDDSNADEALVHLRAAARDAPDDLFVQANLGWGAFRLGRRDEGIAALEALLAVDPSRVTDRARLGIALLTVGRTREGRDALGLALALQPGASWAPRAEALLAGADAS
jgi:choline-sulfatase